MYTRKKIPAGILEYNPKSRCFNCFRNVGMKYNKKYAKNGLFIFICTWHDHNIKDGKPENASCTHKYIVD